MASSMSLRVCLLAVVALLTINSIVSSSLTGGEDNDDRDKSFRICNVHSALEIARLTSTKTRVFFQSAIDDVEQLREYASEAMYNGGIVGGLHTSLDDLAATLDWEARNLPENTTTLEAGLGWADDRLDRRVERYVGIINEPHVGSKEADLAMADTLSNVLPWIVDRKSLESFWWLDHQNGHSEGPNKEEFRFKQLYTAAWIITHGEALLYYPPFHVWKHPFTMADIVGPAMNSRRPEVEFVYPNYPENNPTRQAKFSAPYPDTAVPGLSLITAMAPMYYTGEWYGYTYNDTYMASIGIDIAIASVSSLLDKLEGSLTGGSFALLVDSEFRTIVISQSTVEKIYPRRTGFEPSRVTYNLDGSITEDRRNQTYLPSDAILQGLRNLTNANWTGLHSDILKLSPGGIGNAVLNITLTGDSHSTPFYAMYERWPDVADFVLLALAPVIEVDLAIDVKFLEPGFIDVQAAKGETAPTNLATFANEGTLDVIVSLHDLPNWIQLVRAPPANHLVRAGHELTLEFSILGDELPAGSTNTLVTLDVEDAYYPDCAYSRSMSFMVSVEKESTNPFGSLRFVGPVVGGFLVLIFLFTAWIYHKRNKNDAVWKVENKELIFDDPPEICGRGTFANVLLAEYRGTRVAVKRVIPSRIRGQNADSGTRNDPLDNLFRWEALESGSGDSTSSNGVGDNDMVFGTKSNNHPIGDISSSSSYVVSKEERRSEAAQWRKLRADFIKEMRILSKLRHPCITTVMGAVVDRRVEPMLVMEFMEYGSLYDLLHNETIVIDGELLLPILRDISQGMRFLHAAEPQVIHGDLKGQNILVDSKFRAKVADFGLSQKRNVGCTGTPYWMAPELLRGESQNTAASDVYSFGICLYEVYSRQEPYKGENPREVLRLVADRAINKRPPVPANCPAKVQSLMEDCLVMDPEQRPTFKELDQRLKRADYKNVDPCQRDPNEPRLGLKSISLFDIFPVHIAEALRDGKKVEAEHKECVTIFFCDIVGFTDISASLDPRRVANLLDRLYHKFDDLSHIHDVFKVETIGDSYMAVTNLIKNQSNDHVKRIADFSLDVIRAANTTLVDTDDSTRGFVNIRIGFHSGPVVADVVGSRNPRYCLFGDTVNTASRMESNSKVNRIHCSERAAELLQKQCPTLPISCRGEIKVKGKGEMVTFWVHENTKKRDSDAYVAMEQPIKLLETDSTEHVVCLPSFNSVGVMEDPDDLEIIDC